MRCEATSEQGNGQKRRQARTEYPLKGAFAILRHLLRNFASIF